MYTILTSKPGQYHAKADESATTVEAYEYLFYGRIKAVFQVVLLAHETRVCITEDAAPFISNSVPTKFLQKFDTLDEARASLQQLIGFGGLDARLRRCDARQTMDTST